jgi:hypothetical protein
MNKQQIDTLIDDLVEASRGQKISIEESYIEEVLQRVPNIDKAVAELKKHLNFNAEAHDMVKNSLNSLQKQMKVHDKEREYTNPFERAELIDLLVMEELKEVSRGLSAESLGLYVQELLKASEGL